MTNEQKEKILLEGSVRQKIRLFYHDVAYTNIFIYSTMGENSKSSKPKYNSLKETEKYFIQSKIRSSKELYYYNRLRTYNRSFLFFKPEVSSCVGKIKLIFSYLYRYTEQAVTEKIFREAINNMINVAQDSSTRESLLETALESLVDFKAKRYQKNFIELPASQNEDKMRMYVGLLNENAKDAKEYIKTLQAFLKKDLPLQPYKFFLTSEEKEIKRTIDSSRELILKYLKIKGWEPGSLIITRYDDIEGIEITEESLEDIKNAGL